MNTLIVNELCSNLNAKVIPSKEKKTLKLRVKDLTSKQIDYLSQVSKNEKVEDLFLKRSGTGITIIITSSTDLF